MIQKKLRENGRNTEHCINLNQVVKAGVANEQVWDLEIFFNSTPQIIMIKDIYELSFIIEKRKNKIVADVFFYYSPC